MKKTRKKFGIRRAVYNRGASLIYAILLVGAMAMTTMYVIDAQRLNHSLLADKRVSLELRLLLEDVKEVGKYLILYEKAFYAKHPLISDMALKKTWETAFATFKGPCGYMTANGSMTVDKVEGPSINGGNNQLFCAVRLRDGSMSDTWLEKTVLPFFVGKGLLEKVRDGHHKFKLSLGDDEELKSLSGEAKGSVEKYGILSPLYFINLSNSSKLRSKAFQENYKLTASLTYEMKTKSYGVHFANTAERLFEITAEIALQKKSGGILESIFGRFAERRFKATETISLVASDPRIFALFVPYPASAIKNEELDPDVVASYDQDIKLPRSKVHGKVFFNGGIFQGDGEGKNADWMTALDDKKGNFGHYYDAFVLSKGWGGVQGGYVVPGVREIQLLKKHFAKGIVSNLNAPRFILNAYKFEGGIIDNHAKLFSVERSSKKLVNLMRPSSTTDAIQDDYKLAGNNIEYLSGDCYNGHDLNCFKKDKDHWHFLNPAVPRLTVADGSTLFVQAVMEELIFKSSGSTFYGVVMPGKITAGEQSSTTLYSLYNMSPGLEGISNERDFNEANIAAYDGSSYLSFPLTSFPSVYSPKQGFH
ncbi:MAG: hypothetical protein J6Y94_02720 [Bacteriovoracaceae bacterium]|nr:hypothetical protein [Bacteriovoracaceae bacterium]